MQTDETTTHNKTEHYQNGIFTPDVDDAANKNIDSDGCCEGEEYLQELQIHCCSNLMSQKILIELFLLHLEKETRHQGYSWLKILNIYYFPQYTVENEDQTTIKGKSLYHGK